MKAYEKSADTLGGTRLPLNPQKWGAVFWDTLHYITLGYPETNPTFEVQQAASDFMASLPFLLPCTLCRQHLADTYLTDMPLSPDVFYSRQNFGTYVVKLRDLIKTKHVCPECKIRRHEFPQDVANRLLSNHTNLYCILLIIPISIIIFFRYGSYTKQTPRR